MTDPTGPMEGDARAGWKRHMRTPALIAGPTLAIIAALFFYLHGGRYETTDDAYLQAGLGSVAANVSGPVVEIAVKENQRVAAGTLLFRVDPAPFQAAVDEAAAQLAEARAQVLSTRATFRQGQSQLSTAQAQVDYAAADVRRKQELHDRGIASQAQLDQATLELRTARQSVATAMQAETGVAASLAGGVHVPIEKQAAVKRAQAVLERALLNLNYTAVRAREEGIVTRVNQLRLGDYVSASKPVFRIAGTRLWIEANFKENQLRYMRLGQPATFTIDAFPDLRLHGHIESFSPGTGNSFSLLPPENATGNWVKVTQRLPVQFAVDNLPRNLPLSAGQSVDVDVDTGHRRHLLGADTPPVSPGHS